MALTPVSLTYDDKYFCVTLLFIDLHRRPMRMSCASRQPKPFSCQADGPLVSNRCGVQPFVAAFLPLYLI